mmetsp:Transcript_39408/g.70619  ORF Transcript_39408/g.70619 Transcript_39408/m.70619 type:complete len:210 (+) Transcript_39408:1345-1974(+)
MRVHQQDGFERLPAVTRQRVNLSTQHLSQVSNEGDLIRHKAPFGGADDAQCAYSIARVSLDGSAGVALGHAARDQRVGGEARVGFSVGDGGDLRDVVQKVPGAEGDVAGRLGHAQPLLRLENHARLVPQRKVGAGNLEHLLDGLRQVMVSRIEIRGEKTGPPEVRQPLSLARRLWRHNAALAQREQRLPGHLGGGTYLAQGQKGWHPEN